MLKVIGEVPPADTASTLASADLAIIAGGYESRARAFIERFAFPNARKVSACFRSQRVLAFDENILIGEAHGFTPVELDDGDIGTWIATQLRVARDAIGNTRALTVFIDISSQSRARLAGIMESLCRVGEEFAIDVAFGYSFAAFSSPPARPLPNVSIGPVSPYFAGWTHHPDWPVSLIIGLGYEPDRALGAVELLEPAEAWALRPVSAETSYDDALTFSNAQLIRMLPDRVLEYRADDPNSCLALVSSLAMRLATTSRVMLLPSGPKLLVLICLLLACDNDAVAVWRVSGGEHEPAVDRQASGRQVVFRCLFTPMPIT